MKNANRVLSICSIFSITLFSCGKLDKSTTTNEKETDNFKVMRSTIISSDGSSAALLQGYNKMGFSFAESCLDNANFSYPKDIEKSIVNYTDNLKEVELRKILNIGVSASVPVKGIEISPELKFSREAAATRLGRTTTYFAYVRLGDSKITEGNNNRLTLKQTALSNFDNTGKLKDHYNFIKRCGDEVITSQKLSAKIMVTLKLSFDSRKELNEFEAKIGAVKNFLVDQGKISVSGKLNLLSDETRKHAYLNLYGVQMGGKPIQLTSILGIKSSCRLDKVEECQSLFDKLNKYVSEDFGKQLDVKNVGSWSVESSVSSPYDELSITDTTGRPLDFQWVKNSSDSSKLSKLKAQVSHEISKQVDNYTIAFALRDSKYLADDEKVELYDILNKSRANIDLLNNFSKECYRSITQCLNEDSMKINNLITSYDETILQPNIGNIISKIRSKNSPLPGQKHRSSEDFLNFRSIIDSGKYSSLYFKLKTTKNTLMRNGNIRFDLMCNKPWYKGFDPVIFSGLFPNYEILIDTVEKNYDNNCSGKELAYIANPDGISESDFMIEVWGRD